MNVFSTTRRVEFRDTDAAGIMHFAALMTLMEQAEHDFLRSLELPLFREIDGGEAHVSWPRIAADCEFKSPLRFEDIAQIEVSVDRLGGRSVTYHFRLTCDSRLVATGSMTSVCCRIGKQGMESLDVPPEFRTKLRPYLRESSPPQTE